MKHSALVCDEDVQYLVECFGNVNTKHFKGMLQTSIIWSIPPATDITRGFKPTETIEYGSEDYTNLLVAIKAYERGNLDLAEDMAKALVHLCDSRVFELLIYIARSKNSNWQHWAEQRNQQSSTVAKQACSSTERHGATNLIRIHPSLAPSRRMIKKLPTYVMEYIIRHEGLHQHLNTTSEDPHPQRFIELDNQFSRKEKALEFIHRLGFAVI